MSARQVKMKKRNRPDGLSLDRYKGHENWSYRRWAWEFLRRDEEFIRACAAVDRKDRSEEDVAREFHLVKFKHCNMSFDSKKSPVPSYTTQTVKKWVILKNDEPKTAHIGVNPGLQPGQVLLRFDLNQEFIVGGSLEAQLRVAKSSLKSALATYSEAIGKKPAPTKRPERTSFLELLRRLDAVAAHDVSVQGLVALQPDAFRDLESDQRSKKAASLMRTPKEYAKKAYLTLAIYASK